MDLLGITSAREESREESEEGLLVLYTDIESKGPIFYHHTWVLYEGPGSGNSSEWHAADLRDRRAKSFLALESNVLDERGFLCLAKDGRHDNLGVAGMLDLDEFKDFSKDHKSSM